MDQTQNIQNKISKKINSLQEISNVQYQRPANKNEEYTKRLFQNKDALIYLVRDRKFSLDTIKHFQLGLTEKNRLSIPIYKEGVLIDYKFRTLPPEEKGFFRTPNSETYIFNENGLDEARKKNEIYIMESETDCMALYQHGFKNVISLHGGCGHIGSWIKELDDIPRVVINLDNDEPGQKAARKLAEHIGLEKCYNIVLPVKDANDFFKKYTATEFQNAIDTAKKFRIKDVSTLGDFIDELKESKDKEKDFKFGYPGLDEITGGFNRKNLILFSGYSGHGKCFGRGIEVLMYDGSIKKVEDIKIGDQLMGDDSTPRNVLFLNRGRGVMYEINPLRGEKIIVNSDHILCLKRTGCYKKKTIPQLIQLSVKDYFKKSKSFKRFTKLYRIGVGFQFKDILIDPYFLGIWLGDGVSRSVGITTSNNNIKNYITNVYKKNKLLIRIYSHKGKTAKTYCGTVGIKNANFKKNNILNSLKYYNLLNNKHIPKDYKFNTRKIRLQLLAGLIDSDGYVSTFKRGGEIIKNNYAFTNKNRILSYDLLFLARSLGFYSSISSFINNKKRLYYKVYISGDCSKIPVKVLHKKVIGNKRTNVLLTGFSIKKIGKRNFYGFELDKNKRFLLKDFIVTHNSTMAHNLMMNFCNDSKPSLLIPLEDDPKYSAKRMLNIFSKVDVSTIPNYMWDNIKKDMINFPLYIYTGLDKFNLDIFRNIVEVGKKLYNIEIFVLDHIHFLAKRSKNQVEEVGFIMRELIQICRDYNVAVISLAHIRKRQDDKGKSYNITKMPSMDDLKGGSDLYQDSHMVLMLLQKREVERDLKTNNIIKQKVYLDLAVQKNREGRITYENEPLKFDFDVGTGIIEERTDDQQPENTSLV